MLSVCFSARQASIYCIRANQVGEDNDCRGEYTSFCMYYVVIGIKRDTIMCKDLSFSQYQLLGGAAPDDNLHQLKSMFGSPSESIIFSQCL